MACDSIILCVYPLAYVAKPEALGELIKLVVNQRKIKIKQTLPKVVCKRPLGSAILVCRQSNSLRGKAVLKTSEMTA